MTFKEFKYLRLMSKEMKRLEIAWRTMKPLVAPVDLTEEEVEHMKCLWDKLAICGDVRSEPINNARGRSEME